MKELATLGFLLVCTAAAIPIRAGAEPTETMHCTGVHSGSSAEPLQDLIRIDFGSLVLVLEEDISPRDSTYIVDLVKDLVPEMVEVLGQPGFTTELSLTLGGAGGGSYTCSSNSILMPPIYLGWQTDDDHDGAIDEDPFDGLDNDADDAIDEDLPNSPLWDGLFAHELAHAFQGDILCEPYPRWLTEGMAEAVAWFVSKRLGDEVGRRLNGSAYDLEPGNDDLLDHLGPQVLGGSVRPIDRPSADAAYSAAGGTLIFPSLAEMASGRERPLARLTDALRVDLPSVRYLDTIDRVFVSPVDGVLPPSRWIQSRSVVCPSVADGTFLAITPSQLGVNPVRIGIMYFSRQGYDTEWLHISNYPTYTGVYGEKTQATRFVYVPELTPGAYRVNQREPGDNGSTLNATSWVLIVHDQLESFRTRTSVAAVFVDPQGNPVDVPGLSVDGIMRERVPGGCLVEPVEGAGTVTFRTPTARLGTVLVIPDRLRLVILPVVSEPPRGVVTWSPYRPSPGGELVACLRLNTSALASDSGPVRAFLQNLPIRTEAEEVWTGSGDRLYARFSVPAEMTSGEVSFTGSSEEHHSLADGIVVDGNGGPTLIAVHSQDASLLLEFDRPVNPSSLEMDVAQSPSAPWVPNDIRPVAEVGSETRWTWPLPASPSSGLARVRDLGRAGDGVLCTASFARELPVVKAVALAPFPNPSDMGTLWPLELAESAEAVFAVIDVTGRLIHGPEHLRLNAGRNELWWDGRAQGQSAPSGVYFLKVSGPGFMLRNRVVLLPR